SYFCLIEKIIFLPYSSGVKNQENMLIFNF
ncbi:MAG: hypothetical protein ACI9UT_001363, partial [Flavobacteriales bacterium]